MDSERSDVSRRPRRSFKKRLWPSAPRKRKHAKKFKANTRPVGMRNRLQEPKQTRPPDPDSEPEDNYVPPAPEPIIVTGKRSCTLRRCAFVSCPNHTPAPDAPEGITYFPFPKYLRSSARWARVVGRAQGAEFTPKPTSAVCARHFAPWQILPDARGGAKLLSAAVPSAEPPPATEENRNIEEVLLEEKDLDTIKTEMESSEEVRQAVDSLVDIPPPENGIRIQCLGDNETATLHYLSVDKDYTVNHTRVNINKNNIATLNYVDTNNKVNHTLKCINLNEQSISTYEELVKPNITNVTKEDITKQGDANSSSNDENSMEQIENTAQMNSTTNLTELAAAKNVIFDDNVKIEVLETNDTSEILPCDVAIKQELSDTDELYVVEMEYED